MTDSTPTELAAYEAMRRQDEAYQAEHDMEDPTSGYTVRDNFLAMLRAVPLDYCIQRAINEGALVLYHTHVDLRPDRDPEPVPLYRLASENETHGGPASADADIIRDTGA